MRKLDSKRAVKFLRSIFKAGMATACLICSQSAFPLVVTEPEGADYAAIRKGYDSAIANGANQARWISVAAAQCDSFLSVSPGSRRRNEVMFFKGHILFEAARYEDAKTSLRAVLAIKGDSSRNDDAEYYLARSLFEQDSLAKAQAVLARFEKKYPESALNGSALFYAGLSAYKREMLDTAQLMLQKVLDRYPATRKRDDARYFLARTLNDRKKYKEALAGFRAVYAAAPTGPYADNALFHQGSAAYSLKDYPGTITLMRDLISRFPGSLYSDNARFFIGKSLHQQGKTAQAETEFKMVADMKPPGNSVPKALYYLARIRLGASDCKGAAIPVKRLRAEFPGSTPRKWADAKAVAKGCAIR